MIKSFSSFFNPLVVILVGCGVLWNKACLNLIDQCEAKPLPLNLPKKYKSVRLVHRYRQESKQGVVYLDSQERKTYQLIIKEGLFYTYTGKLIYANLPCPLKNKQKDFKLLSNKNPSRNFSKDSHKHFSEHTNKKPNEKPNEKPEQEFDANFLKKYLGIFIMDEWGTFYFSSSPKKGKFHHSSFLAGAPVAGAGEMLICQGKLIFLNNQSGHYQPPPGTLKQVLQQLKIHSVPIRNIQVKRFGIDF